jgi:hypothetical protein
MFSKTMFRLLGPDTITHDTTSGGEEGEVHAPFVSCGVIGVAHGGGLEVFYGGIVFGLVGVGFAEGEGVVAVGFGGVVEGTNLIHNDMNSIMLTILRPGLLTTMLLFEEGSRGEGGVEGELGEDAHGFFFVLDCWWWMALI